jgi:hypothetical protein
MKMTKKEALKLIKLNKLNFKFKHPPLLVSGVAMMYHGLRKSDKDIDFILHSTDHKKLAKKLEKKGKVLPKNHKVGYKPEPLFVDLFDDHGILIYEFELWDSIMRFDYNELKENAVKEKDFLVISLEKLMFLSTIRGKYEKRYLDDALLIAKKLSDNKYKNFKHIRNQYWKKLFKK